MFANISPEENKVHVFKILPRQLHGNSVNIGPTKRCLSEAEQTLFEKLGLGLSLSLSPSYYNTRTCDPDKERERRERIYDISSHEFEKLHRTLDFVGRKLSQEN